MLYWPPTTWPPVTPPPANTPPLVQIYIRQLDGACAQAPVPWSGEVKLPPLQAGSYQMTLAEYQVGQDTLPPVTTKVQFVVSDSCPGGPGAPPFVDQVVICPAPACDPSGRPICPTDSIAVFLSGRFPNTCYFLRRIDVLPPLPTFRVAAPRLRLLVDNGCCLGRPCAALVVPWQASLTLPPLPGGPYDLTVMVAEVCCQDSASGDSFPTGHFPFAVADSCGPKPDCLLGTWIHPPIPEQCEGYIAPGQPAQITFALYSRVALAGLQGKFAMSFVTSGTAAPPIRITDIQPVGPAAGMHLRWSQTDLGADFVMFADEGAPIPANLPSPGGPTPVLAITAEAVPGATLPQQTLVYSTDLLGADAQAQGVPPCPILFARPLGADVARICTVPGCDFNQDGRVDVRDLVAMVHCVRSESCRTSSGFDCNADGTFNIDDVLCCAMRILRVNPCTTCPPDTTSVHKDPNVRLTLRGAVKTDAGVDVPLTLERAERVGAARVALRFPADRYELRSVDMTPQSSDWIQLADVENDQIVVGLIQVGGAMGNTLAGGTAAPQQLDLTIHLALKPGQSAGGEISSASGEFSATDGSKLEIAMSTPSQPLGGGLDFALSENRPEPFTGETRFTVTLPKATAVDLGVYDVTGRRIATLHHGQLEAGVSEFRWNGRMDGGERAQNGIYFYRATADGRTASRKMVLLRGE